VTDDDDDYNNMEAMKEFLLVFPFLHIINKSEDVGTQMKVRSNDYEKY